jgi:peptide/nickel transport system substrate-binding protein/oligopeptide transport system substrate-binding protein
MKVRRLATWTALPLTLALGLAACGSGGGSETGGSSDVIVRQGIGDPEHLVPTNVVESNGSDVLNALFTPLVKFDANGKVTFEGAAAESITTTDNKVWTVKLKDGFTFHNGEKVTAQNYIDAWNYGAYGPNAQIGTDFFSRIEGYEDLQSTDGAQPKAKEMSGLKKVDDLTFTVTLSKPFAEWQKVMGYNVFLPMPKAAFADMEAYEKAPIGQGPFKMKGEWERDKQIETERYEAYPLAKPKIKGVLFKIYADYETEYNDLLAGNLDIMTQLPSTRLASAKTELGDRMKTTPSSYFAWLTVPSYSPQFKNPDLRKALSMAIDRDAIVEKIFAGAYTPAHSWVSPIVDGARPDTCGEACEFNPAKAKELYERSGGLPGNKLAIYYNADGGHKEWVDAVANQLRNNLGIDATGQPVAKFAELRQQARAHTLEGLLRGAWSFDYPSMENYLTPLMRTGGSSNDSQYSNPEFDRLLEEGDTAPTPEEAIKKYQAAEDLIAKDLPLIPLWFKQNIYGHSANVKNVELDLFTHVDLLKVEAA